MDIVPGDQSQALYAIHRLPRDRSIHILDIKSNEAFESPVEASTEVVDLPPSDQIPLRQQLTELSSQDYQAVSYAWGDPTATRSILVDGFRVSVTAHLEAGLKRIREKLRPTDIFFARPWIDAICINQSDVSEQTQQVMTIGDVFGFARRLIIWLGEATQDQVSALNSSDDERLTMALMQLVENSYFRRRWVLQEIFLTTTERRYILYGSTRKHFDSLLFQI